MVISSRHTPPVIPSYEQPIATATPNFVAQALSEKVSQFLVIARERTANDRNNTLLGLASVRDCLVSDLGGEEITLETLDGALINGVHFKGALKKGIIFLHGNGCFYETSAQKPLGWIESLKQASPEGENLFPHLVVFNPSGTGKSSGLTHPANIARDMLAAFEYLVYQQGINPNDIVIAGHSMGAFFGAFGADLIQQRFPDSEINFLSDRSFIDIHSRADMKIRNGEHSRAVQYMLCSTMPALIASSKWDMNPLTATERLKGRVCIIYHKDDGVVPYATSFYLAVTQVQRRRSYSYIELQGDGEVSCRAHNREFNDKEHRKVIAELKKMLRLPLAEEEELVAVDLLDRSL